MYNRAAAGNTGDGSNGSKGKGGSAVTFEDIGPSMEEALYQVDRAAHGTSANAHNASTTLTMTGLLGRDR